MSKMWIGISIVVVVLIAIVAIVTLTSKNATVPGTQEQAQTQNEPLPIEDVVPPGWNQFFATGGHYTFLFPDTWFMQDGGSDAHMVLSNNANPDISKQPVTVILDLATRAKSVQTTLEVLLKNGVPAASKASSVLTTGTTRDGANMAKITFGKGVNQQAVYAIEINAGEVIVLNVNGYIVDPIIDEIAKSFTVE